MTKDLAAILESCLKELDAGKSIQECLSQHPDWAAELEPLLHVAEGLRNLPKPVPRPEAGSEALVRLGAALSNRPGSIRVRQSRRWAAWATWLRPPIFRWAMAAVAAIVLTWGITAASARSLPGDLLYPLKLATERVTFAITRQPDRRAELRLSFADQRLNELLRQAEEQGQLDPSLLKQLLHEADLALIEAQPISEERYRLFLTKLHHVNSYQQAVLEGLASRTSWGDSTILRQAISVCEERGQWMERMGCGPGNESGREVGNGGDASQPRSQREERNQVGSEQRTTSRDRCWGSGCRW